MHTKESGPILTERIIGPAVMASPRSLSPDLIRGPAMTTGGSAADRPK